MVPKLYQQVLFEGRSGRAAEGGSLQCGHQFVYIQRLLLYAALAPLHSPLQGYGVYRFKKIIYGIHLKGLHCVVVVSCCHYDRRRNVRLAEDFKAFSVGQFYVHENYIRLVLGFLKPCYGRSDAFCRAGHNGVREQFSKCTCKGFLSHGLIFYNKYFHVTSVVVKQSTEGLYWLFLCRVRRGPSSSALCI